VKEEEVSLSVIMTNTEMGIASYEARSDPESLRMERTEKKHTFI
jgi:hypothetical protein